MAIEDFIFNYMNTLNKLTFLVSFLKILIYCYCMTNSKDPLLNFLDYLKILCCYFRIIEFIILMEEH